MCVKPRLSAGCMYIEHAYPVDLSCVFYPVLRDQTIGVLGSPPEQANLVWQCVAAPKHTH